MKTLTSKHKKDTERSAEENMYAIVIYASITEITRLLFYVGKIVNWIYIEDLTETCLPV